MNLTRKLLSSFGVMLALVLAFAGLAVFLAGDFQGDLNRAVNVTARQQYLAGSVSTEAAEITSLARGSVLSAVVGDGGHASAYQRQFGEAVAKLQKVLRELGAMSRGQELSAILRSLEEQAGMLEAGGRQLQQALGNQQMDAALGIFSQLMQPRLEQIGQTAAGLVDQQNRELGNAAAAAASKSSKIRKLTLLLGLLALAAGTLVFWIVRGASVELRGLAARMAESAGHVANAASQVWQAGQSVAQGASEQTASLGATSAATEEIVGITHRNADNALQVAGLMQQSEHGAAEVNQSLDRMVAKMREIDSSSNKIARIIKVIDEIAFQTNILALNAAVEAARAGDAGLGFAVVADEVRNLAQRCARAAQDTTDLIEESIATTHDGNTCLEQMAGAVRAMTESSVRVKSLVDEVNSGSQEQTSGIERISQAVLQMQNVTKQTAEGAQESASAGTELIDDADRLQGLVGEMREMVGAG